MVCNMAGCAKLVDSDPISDIEKVGNMKKRQQEGNLDEVDKIKIKKAKFVASDWMVGLASSLWGPLLLEDGGEE
jgi:hypothetical protein